MQINASQESLLSCFRSHVCSLDIPTAEPLCNGSALRSRWQPYLSLQHGFSLTTNTPAILPASVVSTDSYQKYQKARKLS